MIIKLKIDVTKIDKALLFKGEKGTYLDCTLLLKDGGEVDNYGNSGMVVQDVSKETREAGGKGAILGNAKIVGNPISKPATNGTKASVVEDDSDGLPF